MPGLRLFSLPDGRGSDGLVANGHFAIICVIKLAAEDDAPSPQSPWVRKIAKRWCAASPGGVIRSATASNTSNVRGGAKPYSSRSLAS